MTLQVDTADFNEGVFAGIVNTAALGISIGLQATGLSHGLKASIPGGIITFIAVNQLGLLDQLPKNLSCYIGSVIGYAGGSFIGYAEPLIHSMWYPVGAVETKLAIGVISGIIGAGVGSAVGGALSSRRWQLE